MLRRPSFFACVRVRANVFSCDLTYAFSRWTAAVHSEACVDRDWRKRMLSWTRFAELLFLILSSVVHCGHVVNIYSVEKNKSVCKKRCEQWRKKKTRNKSETTSTLFRKWKKKVVAREIVIMVIGEMAQSSHWLLLGDTVLKDVHPVQKLHSSFCLELIACLLGAHLLFFFFCYYCLCHPTKCMKYVNEKNQQPQNFVSLIAVLLWKIKTVELL